MVVLLMGVSGSGKTAVGERLAMLTSWPFVDGDDLHPPANIEKMSAGVPLSDVDRQPWLAAIRQVIEEHERVGTSAIIACSALKAKYRRYLLTGTQGVRLVYLQGDQKLLEQRLRDRRGHFFDASLLASQLATLEEPVEAVRISVEANLESVTAAVVTALGLETDRGSEEEG